jgi:hypothetical protein
LRSIGQPKRSEQLLNKPNGMIIAVFWMSSASTEICNNISPNQFSKKPQKQCKLFERSSMYGNGYFSGVVIKLR